ncbi:hypothetical protein GCM10027615_52940 [Plantactinospora veratri]
MAAAVTGCAPVRAEQTKIGTASSTAHHGATRRRVIGAAQRTLQNAHPGQPHGAVPGGAVPTSIASTATAATASSPSRASHPRCRGSGRRRRQFPGSGWRPASRGYR